MSRPTPSPNVAKARSKHALTIRYHSDDEARVTQAKQVLKEAVLAEKIRAAVESAPPLSPAQLCRLQALLSPSGGGS